MDAYWLLIILKWFILIGLIICAVYWLENIPETASDENPAMVLILCLPIIALKGCNVTSMR